jgi:protein-S-isoprenylcysteine O-methyltransferase Ste14
LNVAAFGGLFFVMIVMAALVFVSAGTLDYWQAWAFLGVFGALALAITLYLMKYDPSLLQRRVRGGPGAEKDAGQKIAMSFASLGFVVIFVIAGFDHRFHWSTVPPGIVIFGDLVIVLGWAIVFRVFRENPFSSATIEVAADQRVITTGPYAVVRHPMYSGALLYLLAMPLALGSWWAAAALLLLAPALLWRLFDEEKFLANRLAGYSGYCGNVKHRLVPGVW